MPTEVSGKGGYQPITENTQQLGTGSGGENNTNLGYGETGDGLTFDTAFYPYYQMLDEKGKHLYRQIYANANAVNAAFQPIESVEVSAIKDIIEAVYNDHPELFWLNTAFTASMTATISVRRLIWNSMILPRIYPRPWKHSAMKPVRFCGR